MNENSYQGGETERNAALKLLEERDGLMYILGRHDTAGNFKTASDLSPPRKYSDLFKSLVGQAPISSTALRELAAQLKKDSVKG